MQEMNPLPTITRAEIETAAPYLYRIDEPPQRVERFYDIRCDQFRSGMASLLVCIDHGAVLPAGCVEARFRSDGRRVVIFQALDPDQSTVVDMRTGAEYTPWPSNPTS